MTHRKHKRHPFLLPFLTLALVAITLILAVFHHAGSKRRHSL